MKFQTNQCPLCNKMLKLTKVSGVTTYYCDSNAKPHYEVETDGKITIQHFYVFPYAVDNFANSTRSRVYKWRDSRWKFIEETQHILPCQQRELLERLRSVVPLVPFPSDL